MTFRSRLVVAAAVAVVIAVLGACAAAYVASRDSLVGSVDGTLQAVARNTLSHTGPIHVDPGNLPGLTFQIVDPSGTVLTGGGLPVTRDARQVAAGRTATYFDTLTIRGIPYRELVVHLRVQPTTSPFPAVTPAAFQLALPLSSVHRQLAHLRAVLTIIAVVGIAVAVVLAWLVGRTALVPLNDLTDSVEDVAATTDVSRRLDPGGPDELGRLRRAFNHLLSALQRSQQAQRQLVLDAGHELRTPLTSLQTNLEVVRRLEELPPEDRAVLVDDLLTQMNELTKLVADLSELARGDMRPEEPLSFRLDRVVEEAVAVASAHGRPREVAFHLEARPTWIRGRRDRIVRAVGNLLDNALKWSADGGQVEVTCGDGTVTVRDHGPGISAEDLPHIFDRFYRAPGARRLPGSGLGLAIVAQVAEDEGGSVTAGSAIDGGGGAVFRLSFPPVTAPAPRSQADTRRGVDDEDDDDGDEDLDGQGADVGQGGQAQGGQAQGGQAPRGRGTHDANGREDQSQRAPANGAEPGVRAPGWEFRGR